MDSRDTGGSDVHCLLTLCCRIVAEGLTLSLKPTLARDQLLPHRQAARFRTDTAAQFLPGAEVHGNPSLAPDPLSVISIYPLSAYLSPLRAVRPSRD